MADAKNRPAKRCTILIDIELYDEGKKSALDKKLKLYQYINYLIAKDTKKEFPKYLKHPPSNNNEPETQSSKPKSPETTGKVKKTSSNTPPVGREQTI